MPHISKKPRSLKMIHFTSGICTALMQYQVQLTDAVHMNSYSYYELLIGTRKPAYLCMYIMYISVLNYIIVVNHSLMASISVSTSTWWQSYRADRRANFRPRWRRAPFCLSFLTFPPSILFKDLFEMAVCFSHTARSQQRLSPPCSSPPTKQLWHLIMFCHIQFVLYTLLLGLR